MRYEGCYEEDHIPFVQFVLRVTYGKGQFIGGRGREYFTAPLGRLTYRNLVSDRNVFTNFAGTELLYYKGSILVGQQVYWGGSLI
jgi:hypothetical protein